MRDPRATENTFAPRRLDLYSYWAKVERLIDGDTIDVTVSLGFEMYTKVRLRLYAINAPEMHGVKHTSDEFQRGLASLNRLQQLIPTGTWVELKVYQSSTREKYGRWLAEVFLEGRNINALLVQEGLATPVAA